MFNLNPLNGLSVDGQRSPLSGGVDGGVETYRLSPMQEGMLFHSLYAEQPGVDIEQLVCTLRESLNLAALEQAWQQVVQRHSVLRTSCHWEGLNEPVQTVHQQVRVSLKQDDWRGVSTQGQRDRLSAFLASDRQHGFDLTQAPLMRLALFQLANDEYQLVWTFHHILVDGRSLPRLLKEVFAFYEAFCQGQDLPLVPPHPYRGYIDWLYQQDFSVAETYWRQLLKGFKVPTPLPGNRISRDLSVFGHSEEQIQLSGALTSALQSVAQQYGITVNTFVQGAWALLLNHYCKTGDIVFGTTRACRHAPVEGAASMVGLLINTLPVRVRISPEIPLSQWLKQLRAQHMAVRPYEQTPLAQIQHWSEVASGASLFDSLVVFENYSLGSLLQAQGGNWVHRNYQLFEQPNYPLTLIAQLDTQLSLKITCDRSRFEQATLTQLLNRLAILLENMVASPEQPLADISCLTEAERHQIVVGWNATEVDYPKHLCLHHLFEAQVARDADAIAVVFDGNHLTYGELNHRANQLAHHLQTIGVKPEELVGVCIERSLEMVIGLLAIVKAGGAYVPLDPTYPPDRLAQILADAQPAVVLTQEKWLSLLSQQATPMICLDTGWQKVAEESGANPTSLVTAENLAYIIYTSGSTGQPKGVLIEHRGAVNTILDMNHRFRIGPQDRVLAVCSLSFDLSVYDIFGLLAAGGTVVIPPPAIAPDLNCWIDLMAQHQITVWNSAPPVMQMFAGHLVDCDRTLPACLRLVLLSGDWIPITLPDLIREIKQGDETVEIISLGGATEASIWSILFPVGAIDPTWKSIPYGKPMANQQFYVLDDRGNPIPAGDVGELYIGGAGVARGYHHRPDLNQTKFVGDRFSTNPGARLYRTGDLGRYMPDGNIEFLGRIDHQVKIRGFRVEVGEIEVILANYPTIREAAVLAQDDSLGRKRLVAYLVPAQFEKRKDSDAAGQALIDTVRNFLKQKLPAYMVPSVFVVVDALPLTPNGKLDRRALPAPPAHSQQNLDSLTRVRPCDEVERQLTEIWQEFLGVSPISLTDNFFELGGHSLLAVRLWAKIEQTFQRDLPLVTLFQAPTIEQLANRLRLEEGLPFCPSLVVIQSGQPESLQPPLFCLHVLGGGLTFCRPFARYLDPQQPIYGLSTHIAGENFASARVEDLAAHYVQQIQRLQPTGTYLLSGISVGGLIAFEIAQQLTAQGQKVVLLALLDTHLPDGANRESISKKLMEHWHQFATVGLGYVLQKFWEIMEGQTQGLMEWLKNSYYRLAVQFLKGTGQSLPESLQDFVYRMQNEQLAAAYVPRNYPGRIIFFKAKGKINPELDWLSFAAGGLAVHEMPGTHLGMLAEPDVQILGETLRACIASAIANGQEESPIGK